MRSEDVRELTELEESMRPQIVEAVPQPGTAALEHVRVDAESRAASSGLRGRPRPVAVAHRRGQLVAAVAVLALVGVVAFGWSSGGLGETAFAAEQAAAALLPEQGVLHFVETITFQSPMGTGTLAPIRVEHWIGSGGKVSRKQARDAAGGQLIEDYVTQGDGGRTRSAIYDFPDEAAPSRTSPESAVATAPTTPSVVSDAPFGVNGPGVDDPAVGIQWWLDLREDLESGKARVVGTEIIDGEEHWRVRSEDGTFAAAPSFAFEDGKWVAQPTDPSMPTYKRTIEARLRKGDYRPSRAVVTIVEDNHGGGLNADGGEVPQYTTRSTTFYIEEWAVAPEDTVPDAIFDLDSIPLDAPRVSVQYLPSEADRFTEFGAWSLAERSELATILARHELQPDSGVLTYERGFEDPLGGVLEGDSDSAVIPPPGWNELSDRYLHTLYSGPAMNVFVASMPKASETSITSFLAGRRASGQAVRGEINGMRYRGYDGYTEDANTNYGGSVVIDAGEDTLVVAYQCSPFLFDRSPLPLVMASIRRLNLE